MPIYNVTIIFTHTLVEKVSSYRRKSVQTHSGKTCQTTTIENKPIVTYRLQGSIVVREDLNTIRKAYHSLIRDQETFFINNTVASDCFYVV